MLTNLLINAVTHAYDEGQAGPAVDPRERAAPDTVRIVFADDGKGIPPENIGKVFDPFFTTGRSTGSTGLGLHIVYNLVTSRLQGRIDLYSKVGSGTRFTIDIPKVVAETAPGCRARAAAAARRSLRICGLRDRRPCRRLCLLGAGAASAKTLVFCSEGNPEALNPQIDDHTTGINAGRPFFNNLVEFAPGSTEIVAGARRSLDDLGRRARNTSSTCAAA